MIGKMMEKRRNACFLRMADQLPSLTNKELKEWYQAAETQGLVEEPYMREIDFLSSIEKELTERGFQYMVDY